VFKWLLRHKLERARYKYLSGNRSQAVFEKYKNYRLLVLRLANGKEHGLAIQAGDAASQGKNI
jgi:hypothetical protein